MDSFVLVWINYPSNIAMLRYVTVLSPIMARFTLERLFYSKLPLYNNTCR